MRFDRFGRLAACLALMAAFGTADVFARGRLFHRRNCVPCEPCCPIVNPCEAAPGLVPQPDPAAAFRSITPKSFMLAAAANNFATTLPRIPTKPTPQSSTFNGCPALGDDRGDQDLNFLKNRIDVADAWIPVGFDAVLNQAIPDGIGRKKRANWNADQLAAVQQYEGIPISIVGSFVWAQDEGQESCNCHSDDRSMADIHTWLSKAPVENRDRTLAIVAEVTPRLKPAHPNWTQTRIRQLATDKKKVRVSGWLLLDQEHPEQLNHTRGTLWEIHPIMQIEVFENGAWVPLDNLQSMLNLRMNRLAAWISTCPVAEPE